MKCKICNNENKSCFSGKLLNKYEVDYFYCDNCGFLQTEEPYWLEEAYSRSINLSDTGYMSRNLSYSKRLTVLFFLLFDKKEKFLDYAGGYGVFVRLMRDVGFDFYWDDKFTKNLFAAGFEWDNKSKIKAITSFESFEHFVNPMEEIKLLINISDTLFFSTILPPVPLPKPKEWWYYGLDHGQHISFYSEETFHYIAHLYGLNYYSYGSLHILTKRHISRWQFLLARFSKFGLHNIVAKKLQSKTWDDYKKIEKLGQK
ncbi:MAG: hypothetical protein ACI9YE_000007 [Psychroserpens sp.]|jgi:hypothetical protein